MMNQSFNQGNSERMREGGVYPRKMRNVKRMAKICGSKRQSIWIDN